MLSVSVSAQVGVGPIAASLPAAIPEPQDKPFLGTVQLTVDATDTAHGVFRTTEVLPVQSAGELTLLYPQWETTSHAPTASVVELAGLHIKGGGGTDLGWRRDSVDVHAFHVTVPPKTKTLTLTFDYLSSHASAELRPHLIEIHWQRLLLYPAGWYTRDITVAAQIRLPIGLRAFSALRSLPAMPASSVEATLAFEPVTLDRLVDAPIYAAEYAQQMDLSSDSTSVHLDLVADSPAALALSPEALGHLR